MKEVNKAKDFMKARMFPQAIAILEKEIKHRFSQKANRHIFSLSVFTQRAQDIIIPIHSRLFLP
jgi:hypothetical protein